MDLIKIAQSEEVTYLEKVAAIVDEFAAGNVTGEYADAIASEVGIDPGDLLGVYNAAYLEKEASIFGKLKDIATAKQAREGIAQLRDAAAKYKSSKNLIAAAKGHSTGSASMKEIVSQVGSMKKDIAKAQIKVGAGNTAAGVAKTTALYGVPAAALFGASKAFRGDE